MSFAGYRPYRWHFSDIISQSGMREAFQEMSTIRQATGDKTAKMLLAGAAVSGCRMPL